MPNSTTGFHFLLVNLKILHHSGPEPVARQHAVDSFSQNLSRAFFLQKLAEGSLFETARVTGISFVNLAVFFLLRNGEFAGVYDADFFSGDDVAPERDFIFSHKEHRRFGRDSAYLFSCGIYGMHMLEILSEPGRAWKLSRPAPVLQKSRLKNCP